MGRSLGVGLGGCGLGLGGSLGVGDGWVIRCG